MSVEFDQCVITRDGNNLLTSASAEHKIKFVKAYAVESVMASLSNLTIQDLENNNAREGFIASVNLNNIAVPIVEEGCAESGGSSGGSDGAESGGGASGEGSIDGGGSRSLDGEDGAESGEGSEITISESENQSTAVIIAGFKSSIDLANSTSQMFAKTIAITAKLDGNDDNTAIVFAVQVTNSSSVYLPGSSDVGAPNTNVTFSVVVGSGEVSIIDIDNAQYSTLAQYLNLANRVVTTHAEGDTTSGEDQTIYGDKTFNGLVILGNNLIPITDEDYSIGRMADPEEGTDTRRLASVNTYTLNTTELGSSDPSGGNSVQVFSTLELLSDIVPHNTNSVSLGSSSKVFKDVYATSFHGALDGTASYATTAGSASSAESATKDGNGNIISNKYVTLDTTQTVTANKQFTSGITLYSSNLTLEEGGVSPIKSTLSCGNGFVTLSTYYNNTKAVDLNYYIETDGVSVDTMQIYPSINNKLQFGTSGKKLKSVYATNFYGALDGNATSASSATKATKDASGNTITSSYAASLIRNGDDTALVLKSKSGATLSTVSINDIIANALSCRSGNDNGGVGAIGLFIYNAHGDYSSASVGPWSLVSGSKLRTASLSTSYTSYEQTSFTGNSLTIETSWDNSHYENGTFAILGESWSQSGSYYKAQLVLAIRVY